MTFSILARLLSLVTPGRFDQGEEEAAGCVKGNWKCLPGAMRRISTEWLTLPALEPEMILEEKDREAWLVGVASLRRVVREVQYDPTRAFALGVKDAVFSQLKDIALRSWRGPSASIQEFPFIRQPELRAIAERDYASLANMRKCEETKACLILAGVVIEAALLDVIRRDPQASKRAAQAVNSAKATEQGWRRIDTSRVEGCSFQQMIALCGTHGLGVLCDRTQNVADAVRDYRNLVHPRVEVEETQKNPLMPSEAAVAVGLADQVLEQVKSWYLSEKS